MIRFVLHAVPLVAVLLFLFSLAAGVFDLGPSAAMTVLDWRRVSLRLLLGTWLFEAFGLVALYLLVEGRSGRRWLDGLMAGWVAWIFRGPLLVVTVVVAAGGPQASWFRLALGWWVLYTVCGLALAVVSRATETGRAAAAETDARETEEMEPPAEPLEES
ncbi:MAG TPA: hypothetical protein VGG06_20615 [Thermoanaerobaculia bacterium]